MWFSDTTRRWRVICPMNRISGRARWHGTPLPARLRVDPRGYLRLVFLEKGAEAQPPCLFGAMEFDVVAPFIQAVFAGVGGGENLQRHWVLDLFVIRRGDLEHIVGAQIHDHKLVAFDKPNAIGTRLQCLPADFKGDFVNEIGLVLFTNTCGVTGIVHQACKNVEPVGVTHTGCIAELRGGSLPAEEYLLRQNLGSDIGCLEYSFFGRGGFHRLLVLGIGHAGHDQQQTGEQQQSEAYLHGTLLQYRMDWVEHWIVPLFQTYQYETS